MKKGWKCGLGEKCPKGGFVFASDGSYSVRDGITYHPECLKIFKEEGFKSLTKSRKKDKVFSETAPI